MDRFPQIKLINTNTWVKPNPTPRSYTQRLVSATEPFFDFVISDDYTYNPHDFLKEEVTKTKDKRLVSSKKGQKYIEMATKTDHLSGDEIMNLKYSIEQLRHELREREITDFRIKIRGIHAPPFGGQKGGRASEIEEKGYSIIRMYGKKMKKDYIICSKETFPDSIHPAMYPEKLIREFILLLTNRNDVVLDPYMGSGTTAISCLKTGRNYIGFEQNKEYVDFSLERIEKSKAEKNHKPGVRSFNLVDFM